MQRTSSWREEAKIAQGETLGKRLPDTSPPRRGGVKPSHRRWIHRSVERAFAPPLWGGFSPLASYPGLRCACPKAIFDGSLREQADGLIQ
jgi:hypothetical protein